MDWSIAAQMHIIFINRYASGLGLKISPGVSFTALAIWIFPYIFPKGSIVNHSDPQLTLLDLFGTIFAGGFGGLSGFNFQLSIHSILIFYISNIVISDCLAPDQANNRSEKKNKSSRRKSFENFDRIWQCLPKFANKDKNTFICLYIYIVCSRPDGRRIQKYARIFLQHH